MERNFHKYKWAGLVTFALMYSLAYLGRFNVNSFMENIAKDLQVSFMQQQILSISIFISYAAGSFVNGYIADRLGGKKTAVLGGVMTIILNMLTSFQSHWVPMLCLWTLNGYCQSMVWVGGIQYLSQWWAASERGKGIGIANFSSGISHAAAYSFPLMLHVLWPDLGWRESFLMLMFLFLFFVGMFQLCAVERPQDKGLAPYEPESKKVRLKEEYLKKIREQKRMPWLYLLRQKKFIWWCMIALFSSICRYGLLNWIPFYFNGQKESIVISDFFLNLTLPVGMAFGTLILTWAAGSKIPENKGLLVTALAAMCGTLTLIVPMMQESQAVLVGVFLTGFALYGINGILWLHAIEQGSRIFSGSAAGIINCFAYLGASLEGIIFPLILRWSHTSISVFVVMEVLCIAMVFCGMVVSRKNTIVMPEIRE